MSADDRVPGRAVRLASFLQQINARLALALSDAHLPTQEPSPRFVTFTLAGARYALPIHHVAEIEREYRITPVPGLPAWVRGVMNWHGTIVSMIDLAQFLGLARTGTPAPMLLVAQAGDQLIGLLVDRVEPIVTVNPAEIMSPPFPIEPEIVPYLRGVLAVDQAFIRVLDGERLLLGAPIQQFT